MAQKGHKSPVILDKQQAQKMDDGNLQERDFVLAIQTSPQADLLKRFGDGKVICIHATHETNSYGFSLITLIVVDDFGEGYPVAWCLTNQGYQKRVGVIVPDWIMSDDADQFYSAWVGVFAMWPKQILCTWHVDRAWRGHLNTVRDKQLSQTLHYNLRVLLEETNTARFEQLLEETRKQLK